MSSPVMPSDAELARAQAELLQRHVAGLLERWAPLPYDVVRVVAGAVVAEATGEEDRLRALAKKAWSEQERQCAVARLVRRAAELVEAGADSASVLCQQLALVEPEFVRLEVDAVRVALARKHQSRTRPPAELIVAVHAYGASTGPKEIARFENHLRVYMRRSPDPDPHLGDRLQIAEAMRRGGHTTFVGIIAGGAVLCARDRNALNQLYDVAMTMGERRVMAVGYMSKYLEQWRSAAVSDRGAIEAALLAAMSAVDPRLGSTSLVEVQNALELAANRGAARGVAVLACSQKALGFKTHSLNQVVAALQRTPGKP